MFSLKVNGKFSTVSKIVLSSAIALGLMVTIILSQQGILAGLFSKKIQLQEPVVFAEAKEETRSPETIQELIASQAEQTQSQNVNSKESFSKTQAENFKKSNVGNEKDLQRIEESKSVVSGEILLKVKDGKSINLESLKKDLQFSDIELRQVPYVDGLYVLRSSISEKEMDKSWKNIKEEDKNRFTNPVQAEDILPTTSKLFTNLNKLGLFDLVSTNPVFTVNSTPNDSYYPSQWHLNDKSEPKADINYPEATDLGIDCSALKIAVLDTGVSYSHPDLKNVITGLRPEHPQGYNSLTYSGNADDDNYHGTHVAGIIGAQTNNNEGISGVCPGAKIVPIKVLDASGSGSFETVISGLNYAIDNNASIINMSLGGHLLLSDPATSYYVTLFNSAISKAKQKNIPVVVAAGNEGENLDNTSEFLVLPASLDNVITVAASDRNNKIASYSNYGKNKVELVAPGSDILSTTTENYTNYIPLGTGEDPRGYYTKLSGTSMASPVVAGAVGALKARNSLLSTDQIVQLLKGTAELNPEYITKSQSGRINLAKAEVKSLNSKATVYAFDDYIDSGINTPIEIKFLENDLVPTSLAEYNIEYIQPSNGAIVSKSYPSTKTVIYTPKSGFSGQDSFTYVLTSRLGERRTAKVYLKVANQTQAPIAKNVKVNVKAGGQTTMIDIAGLAVPGSSPISKADTIIENYVRMQDSMLIVGDKPGVYKYTNTNPNLKSGQTYYDQIAYSVIDQNQKRSNTAYITLEITKGNYAPVFNGEGYIASTPGNSVVVDVLSQSSDPENDALTLKSAEVYNYDNSPVTATVKIENQKLVYTPPLGITSYYTSPVNVVIQDSAGNTSKFNILFYYDDPNSLPTPYYYEAQDYETSLQRYSYVTSANAAASIQVTKLMTNFYNYCVDQNIEFGDLQISKAPTYGTARIVTYPGYTCNGQTYTNYYIVYEDGSPIQYGPKTVTFEYTYKGTSPTPQTKTITINIFDANAVSDIVQKPNIPTVEINYTKSSFLGNYIYVPLSDILVAPMPEIYYDSLYKIKFGTNVYYSLSEFNKSLYISAYNANLLNVGDSLTDTLEFTLKGPRSPTSLPIRINVKITRVNTAPETESDFTTVLSKGSVIVDVLANDKDADADSFTINSINRDTYSLCEQTSAKLEIIKQNNKDYIKYTNVSTNSKVAEVGSGFVDRCNYYNIVDSKGLISRYNGWIDIYVNSAPIISPDVKSVATNQPTTLDLNTLVSDHFDSYIFALANLPTPASNSEINFDSIQILNTPASGTFTFDKTTQQFTFTPKPNTTSVNETINIKVKDVWGAEATGTIKLNSSPKVYPVANNDTASVNERESTAVSILTNDTSPTGTLTTTGVVTIVSQPNYGTASFNSSTRKLNYTQTKEITTDTVDSVVYTVTDTQGLVSNIAKVDISITDKPNINTPPTALNDNFTVLEGTAQALNLISNDTYKNQNIVNLKDVVITSQPVSGIIEKDPKLGTFIYTETKLTDKDITDSFKYKLLDIFGQYSGEATVTLNIKNVNPLITNSKGQSIILKNSISGSAKVWKVDGNGNQISNLDLVNIQGVVETIPASYRLATRVDWDKDGKEDLVFENSTLGKIEIWMLDGNIVKSKSTLKTSSSSDYILPIDTQVISASDFNSDTKFDLLTYNAKTGKQSIIYVNGSVISSTSDILINGVPYLTKGWQLLTSADFNNDTKPDLLLYNPSTGEQIVWILNNQNKISTERILVPTQILNLPSSSGWKISAIGDFNNDTKPDILWLNYLNGRQMLWTLNGTVSTSKSDLLEAGVAVKVPAGWVVSGIGDFNSDNKSDLVLQSATTGEMRIWILNSATIIKRTSIFKSGVAQNPGSSWLAQNTLQ